MGEATFKVLEELLKKLSVEHVIWCKDKVGHYFQVFFPVGAGVPTENCLHCLTQLGIGKKLNSIVSVVPCNVFYHGLGDGTADEDPNDNSSGELIQKKNWDNFVMSIRSKLTVKQVVDGVRNGAECSFDFLLLVLTADMIAAIGLIENSATNIVGAMLVSPMMGPVMAITFGTIIADWKLVKIGLRSNAAAMGISLVFGYIFGLLLGTTEAPWGTVDWPTDEMKARGDVRSLWIAVLFALPAGTGVALGLLQGSAGPLIGVAIAASLLPPVVNCGLLWALACTKVRDENYTMPYLKGEDYKAANFVSAFQPLYYEDDLPKELSVMGIVSCCITLVNICCIFICAILVLKVKEVAAPYMATPDLRRFWEHDIRMARLTNRGTLDGPNATNIRNTDKELLDQLNKIPPQNLGTTLEAAVREAMDDPTFQKIKRCSYSGQLGGDPLLRSVRLGKQNNRTSMTGAPESPLNDPATLENLIQTLVGHQKAAQNRLSRAHNLQQSMRRGSRGSIRSNMTHHGAHSPQGQNQSPGTSVNLGLPPILETSNQRNSRSSLNRQSIVKSFVQSVKDAPHRLLDTPEERKSLTDNIQLRHPDDDSPA